MNETPKASPSQRTDEQRADYTRYYLSSQKINAAQFSKMATEMGSPLVEKDYHNNEKLVTWVRGVQKKLGFLDQDNAKGQDGMLGPRTLIEIKTFLKRENTKNGKVEDRKLVAATIEPQKKPAAAPIEHKGYNGQPETPLSKLTEILSEYEGRNWVGRLSGNGGRPVAIYVPKGFDPKKAVEVAYHFHGTHSHLIDIPRPHLDGASAIYRKHKEGTIGIAHDRIDQTFKSFAKENGSGKRNAIVVYPLSAGQRSRNHKGAAYTQGYDGEWMKKGNDTGDSMEKLHQETLAELGKMGLSIAKPSVTLSGHSAGGVTLKNIMTTGFIPDKVKFLDASYGGWAKLAHQAAKKSGNKVDFQIYVHKGSDKTDNAQTKSLEKFPDVAYKRSPVIHDNFISAFI